MAAFDLDALAREADGEPFVFTFGGDDYELPAQPDIRVAAVAANGQPLELLEQMLGAEQWGRLMESPAVFTPSLLSALLDAYAKHLGLGDVGESEASPSFYRSTVAPSKRTSNGTTRSHSATLARPA